MEFIPGLELSRLYYEEAVRPILDRHYPGLPHSAGLIGPGSEVLGFDTQMSADHHWGPRALLFLSEADHARLAGELRATLGNELPFVFRGFSTLSWPKNAIHEGFAQSAPITQKGYPF